MAASVKKIYWKIDFRWSVTLIASSKMLTPAWPRQEKLLQLQTGVLSEWISTTWYMSVSKVVFSFTYVKRRIGRCCSTEESFVLLRLLLQSGGILGHHSASKYTFRSVFITQRSSLFDIPSICYPLPLPFSHLKKISRAFFQGYILCISIIPFEIHFFPGE